MCDDPGPHRHRGGGDLAVKTSWLYEMVRLGRVPSYRVGKFRRLMESGQVGNAVFEMLWLYEKAYGTGPAGPVQVEHV